MKNNEKLMKETRNAILELFSDTSVSTEVTLENLRTLQQEIEDCCSTLKQIDE